MTQSNITNCIGTYNSIEYLKICIKSIRKNEFFKSPLIVFADGCTDGTNEWLLENKEKYDITCIIEDRCENSSNGYGMNVCASHVETEYINFLHADFYCHQHFDLNLYNIMLKHKDKRYTASSYLIQPSLFNVVDYPGVTQVPLDVCGHNYSTFKEDVFTNLANDLEDQQLNYPIIVGCAFMIKKEDWDFVGGNDISFKPNGYDDTDLFIRMINLGFKYEVTTDSVVFHFAGRGGNGFFHNDTSKRNNTNLLGEIKTSKIFHEKWQASVFYDKYNMVDGLQYKERYDKLCSLGLDKHFNK